MIHVGGGRSMKEIFTLWPRMGLYRLLTLALTWATFIQIPTLDRHVDSKLHHRAKQKKKYEQNLNEQEQTCQSLSP